MNTKTMAIVGLALALVVGLMGVPAEATTYTRQNNTTTLDQAGAWSAGGPPLAGDAAQWNSTSAGNYSTALGASVNWGQIIIVNPGSAITIGNTGGAVLTLNGIGGTGIDMSAATQDLTISDPVTLGGSQTWNIGSSRTLTVGNYVISGGYGITKTGFGTLTLQGANTFSGQLTVQTGTLSIGSINNVNANGVLGNNALSVILGASGQTGTLSYTGGTTSSSKPFTMAAGGTGTFDVSTLATTLTLSGLIDGSGGLTKTGAGILLLSNVANSWGGATTISAGTLSMGAAGNLGGSANLIFNGGGLQITGTGLTTLSGLGRTVVFNPNTTAILDINAAGNTFTADQVISGNLNFTKAGAGTLIFNQANTYSGQTTISAGTLQVGAGGSAGALGSGPVLNSSTLVFNRSDTYTVNNRIMGTGALSNTGGGILVLNAANYYTGTTKATAGTITLSHALAIQNSALDTTGAGAFTLSGVTAPTFGGLSGAGTLGAGSLLATGYSGVTALTLNPAGSVTFTGVIPNGSGNTTLTMTGAGTQILQGANTYSGATTLSAGTLTLSGAAGALASTSIALNGGNLTLDNTSNNLGTRVSDSATITVNGNSALSFTHGGTAGTDYSEIIDTLSLQSGFLTYNGSQANATGPRTSNLYFNTLSRSGTAAVNFAGTGLGSDGRNTIKFGAGVTVGQDLGPWAVVNGADFATYDGTLGIKATANTTLAVDSNNSGTNFKMTGGGITINASLNPSYKTLLVSDSTARTLAINGNTVSVGGISISGATHVISGTGALQALNAGDSLYINVGANALTLSSVVQNYGAGGTASALVKSGAGTLTLNTATSTYTGGTTINAGTVSIDSDARLGASSGGITFNGNGTLTAASAITSGRSITVNSGAVGTIQHTGAGSHDTYSGNLTGNGSLVIDNSNNSYITLGGGGSFTGPLWIQSNGNNGEGLVVTNLNLLADSAAVIKFGGATRNCGNFRMGSSVGGAMTFNNRWIELAGGSTLINNESTVSGRTLTFNKPVVVTTTTSMTLILAGNSANGINALAAGGISDGANGAVVSLSLNSANRDGTLTSTWAIGGTNTYSGGTSVSASTLIFRGKAALPSATAITVTDGTTLKLLDDGAGVIAYGNTFTMANRTPAILFVGNNGAANGGDGAGSGSNGIISLGVYNASTSTSSGGGVNWGLNITGANGYSVRFAGMTLNTANGNNGTMDVLNSACTLNPTTASVEIAGTIQQRNGRPSGGAAFFVLDGTAAGNVISGVIKDAADYPANPNAVALGVTKTNTSVWTLSGANTYSGVTTIGGGTLSISTIDLAANANPLGKSSTVAANLILNGATATLQYTGGAGTMDRLFSVGSSGGILDASGTGMWTLNNSGAMGFNSQTGARTLTLTGTGSGSLAASIGDNTGATALTKSGAGTWALSGASAYTGTTRVQQGTLSINGMKDFSVASPVGAPGSGAIQLGAGGNSGTLLYTGAGDTANRTFQVGDSTAANTGGGVINNSGSGALILSAANLNPTISGITVTRTLTLGGTYADGVNQVQGIIQDNAGGGKVNVAKADAGTWLLAGVNTYTGTTTVNAGTLLASKAAALPGYNAASRVSVVSGATLAARAGGAGEWLSGEIDSLLGATPAAFASGSKFGIDVTTGNSFTYANNIGATQAAKDFVKSGAGTLALSGGNTYTGATTVNGGALQLGAGAGAGSLSTSSAISVAAGAVFAVNQTDTVIQGTDFGNTITGAGGFTQAGSGTTVLTAVNGYTGPTTVSAGTLAGNGTLASNLTAAAGGSIAPSDATGAAGTVGTLAVGGNLDVSAPANGGAGKLKFDLNTPGASDRIAVTGTLTVGVNVLGLGDFNFNFLGGYGPGTYTLITSGGINPGDTLDSGNVSGNLGGYPATLQISGNSLQLVVSSGATVPSVSAAQATGIGTASATLGATIDSNGGAAISSRGTSWSTSPAGNTDNAQAEGGTAVGTFSHLRTGMAAGTKYYAWGWAVNSQGTGYSPSAVFYTEPEQASGPVVISGNQSYQLTVTWTPSVTAGAGTLVLVKEGSAVDQDPADGTPYAATSVFTSAPDIGGGNRAVYAGSGNSVTITGLTAAKTYYVKVYAYAGSALGEINYQVVAPPTANGSTLSRSLVWDADTITTGVQDGNGSWVDGGNNWRDGAISANVAWDSANADNATIGNGGSGTYTITLPGAVTAGIVTFGPFTGSYALSGGGLTVNSNLTVGATAGNVSISTPVSGNGSIVKNGSGSTLALSGSNGYAGGTTINAGTVSFNSDSNLGNAAGGITFGGTGTLTTASAITSARSITVNSGATGTVAMTGGGQPSSYSGNLTGSGTLVVSAGNDTRLTLSGAGSFTGPVWIQGTGQRDGLIVNNGSLLADSAAPIKIGVSGGASGMLELGSGASAGALTFDNRWIEMAGTIALINANTTVGKTFTFTKSMVVTATTASTLQLGGGTAGINVLAAGGITDGAGAVVSLQTGDSNGRGAGNANWAIGGVNTYSGTTTVNQNHTLTFRGKAALPSATAITIVDGATLKLLDDGSGVVAYGNTLTNANRTPAILFVGNNGAANGGDGAGGTTGSIISLGVYHASTSTSTGGGVNWGLNITGANGYSVRFAGMTLNTASGDPLNSACTLNPTTASVEITGTIQQRNGRPAGGSTALVLDGTAAGNVISGVIKDAADYPVNPNAVALGVTKTNTSVWTLSGTNTYSGVTTIGGGTLEIGGAGQLGGGAYATNLVNNATLRWNSTATQTLSGVISGTGALIKHNTGALTLSGINTFTGPTTVSNGTLWVNGALGTNTVTVTNNATLGGTGTVNGAVFVYANCTNAPGTLAGAAPGTFNAASNVTIASGGTLAIDIDDTKTPACDKLAVSRNLNISGATLSVTGTLTQPWYVIATCGSRTGAFGVTNGLPPGASVVYSATEIAITNDVTPPVQTALNPTNNATDVSVNFTPVITFSKAVTNGAGNILIKRVVDDSLFESINVSAVAFSGSNATIPHATFEYGTNYYILIASGVIRDLVGNSFAGITNNSTWTFTTESGVDTTPPTNTALSPTNGATGVARTANLVITFNEDVQKGTGDVALVRTSDHSVFETISVTNANVTVAGNSVTIDPAGVLAFNTGYYVLMTNGVIQDLAGNPFAGITNSSLWSFTTVADTNAPLPDPMAFAVAPAPIDTTAIVMTATNASDESPPVEYFFENTTNNANSGWILSTVWTNTGLALGTTYGYRVKARDSAVPPNETGWSTTLTARAFLGEYFVATNGLDSNSGTSWSAPFRTISNAVAQSDARIVTVSNGTYNITAQIVVGGPITVRSFGGGVYGGLANASNTVVQRDVALAASTTFRVCAVTNAGAVLDGLTIRNGLGRGDNAPSVGNCDGNGLYLVNGIVQNCIIKENGVQAGGDTSHVQGGGVCMASGTLSNCIVAANKPGYNATGGGIWADGGQIVNCTIISNSCPGGVSSSVGGGGIVANAASVSIRNCLIANNSVSGAYSGGGIYASSASTLIRNCLIVSNQTSGASTSGGGVYAGTIESSTIVGNSATNATGTSGGGVYGSAVTNSIVLNNITGSGSNPNYDPTSTFAYSCASPQPSGVGNIDSASFVDAAGGNYQLQSCPAVNAGTNLLWMTNGVDLAGANRIIGGRVDMGAYERPLGPLDCSFVADITSVKAPSNVVFTASVGGVNTNVTSYTWDFGDGQTASGATLAVVTNTYSVPGVYTVVLRVTNDVPEGAVSTNAGYIKVWGTNAYVWAGSPSPALPYHTWANAAQTIGDAVSAAPAGVRVVVTNGTYNIANEIVVSKAITVCGYGNGVYGGLANASNTVVQGPQNLGVLGPRIFVLTAAGAMLDGLTITKGYGRLQGLGVYMTNGCTVMNCIIKNNGLADFNCDHAQGGGVYMAGGTLSNCVVRGNVSDAGTGAGGGGIYATGGQIVNCQVVSNTLVAGALHGGGINAANTMIRNCLIAENRTPGAGTYGGGVYLASGNIESCTIVSNSAASDGGGVCRVAGGITNSIVYFNMVGAVHSNLNTTAGLAYSCSTNPGTTANGCIMDAPVFVNAAAGDYQLRRCPAANAGTNAAWMAGALDLAGNPRINAEDGSRVDMGAYEMVPQGTLFKFR